jgi:hypothetical protein
MQDARFIEQMCLMLVNFIVLPKSLFHFQPNRTGQLIVDI